MARFNPARVHFGRPPENQAEDDDGEDDDGGLPTPLTTRASLRRAFSVRAAREVLTELPAPGESLHVLCIARLDLADVLGGLLERLGRCDRLLVATLGYHRRSLTSMLGWLDSGTAGSLTLLASLFFRAHNGALWKETQAEFRARGQHAACCRSHAKVATLAFADGTRLSIEGSANLCGNGSGREQFALFHDAALHDWHAAWISDLVAKHEGTSEEAGGK